jgi:hypothetical protein
MQELRIMFDLESRKTKAAALVDNSSSVASGEGLMSTTIPCRTPIAASRTKNDEEKKPTSI